MTRKRIVKWLSLIVVFAVVLLTATVGLADAGNFSGSSDFGGGGSGGWSSSDSSGSSSWSGSSGVRVSRGDGEMDIGALIGIIVFVVILVAVFGRRNKGGGSGGSGAAGGNQPAGGAATSRSAVDPVELRRKDPNFSTQEFLEKVSNAYIQMQNCWQSKQWEPMRVLMTDALYSQFDRQLDEFRQNHRTNCVERIAVLGCRIVGYAQDQVNDILTVEVRTRIVDYTVDDETGALLSGSRSAEKFMTYEWTLVRSKDQLTPEKDAVREVHCPSCGAPVRVSQSGQCEYCGQVVTVNPYDWVISAIRGISQVTR